TGSVRDYYTETSYGTVTLQSTVVAWVTLPRTEASYAAGDDGFGSYPNNAQGMVEDALKLVDPLVDFGQFDTDRDGYVDAIDIIHSGYAAETGGGNGNWIWSHKWSLWALPGGQWTSQDNNASGVKVKVYDYHSEAALWGTSGTGITRIGVICHETGHFFGLPDLYDTDNSSEGIGSYCLMANSWGFNGTQQNPPHLSAWCKIKLGWITPTTITSGTFTLPQVGNNKNIYKISGGYGTDEYLLIENRQPFGFERVMPQGGLAIWHIDDSKTGNTEEGYPGQSGWPGNGRHYRVALLQADGRFDMERNVNRGDSGDVYRAGGQASLTPGTVPNTDRYKSGSAGPSNNAITNISASGPTMTFTLSSSSVQPNLTPYQPLGWSNKIVVSTVQGTTTDSTVLSPNDALYVDWAVLNNGSGSTGAQFFTQLYVDNVLKATWFSDPPIHTNNYTYVIDYALGSLAPGSHSIRIKTDSTGVITESNEADNEYTRTITVGSSSFTINTNASPLSGGTTTGAGSFPGGTSATVTAIPAAGYQFINWTEGGTQASTSSSYTFTLTANRSLTANFRELPPQGEAVRFLPEAYVAGSALQVIINTAPASGVTAYSATDTPPSGWVAANITHGGTWDNVNKTVKWGPFPDSFSRALSYQVTPPTGTNGTKTFAGTAAFNGANVTIGGANTIGDAPVAGFRLTRTSSPAAGGFISISPAANLDGKYPAGTVVTLTAHANSGFVFGSWTEDALGGANPVQITMNADTNVTANFLTMKALYNGLVKAETAEHATSGFITLTVNKKASFTGLLWYAGTKYSLRGQFDSRGETRLSIKRRNLAPLDVTLSVKSVGQTTRIAGAIQDGNSLVELAAGRADYNSRVNPAPQAGGYTLISSPSAQNDPSVPQGYGSGTLTVSRSGAVRIVKVLGDGSKISHAASITDRQKWPVYVALYRGKGSVLGTLDFVENDPTRDAGAIMDWFKLPGSGSAFYPTGFSLRPAFVAARYTPPGKGSMLLEVPDAPNNVRFSIAGGDVEPRDILLTLSRGNRIIAPPGDRIVIKFTRGTGAFTGTFIDAETGQKKSFVGSAYQKTNRGLGLFKGSGIHGSVELKEASASSPVPAEEADNAMESL
ncbi:MAG: M6 family metalloprotease domain-containing protein, partial [Verrucomicrobiaceae bacterium]